MASANQDGEGEPAPAVDSEEMEQKVLELAEQPLLDIFLLIFDGGIRPQESLWLEWSRRATPGM